MAVLLHAVARLCYVPAICNAVQQRGHEILLGLVMDSVHHLESSEPMLAPAAVMSSILSIAFLTASDADAQLSCRGGLKAQAVDVLPQSRLSQSVVISA